MRTLLRLAMLVGIIGSIVSPQVRDVVTSTATSALSLIDFGGSEESGVGTYETLCPIFDGYLAAPDGAAKEAVAAAVSTVAAGASADGDPALRAILSVVPASLSDDTSTDTDAARGLLARECDAHGHTLTND